MLIDTKPPESSSFSGSLMRKPVEVSVVVPLYNEEESVTILHREVTDVLTRIQVPYEIVFVNDGSTDGSPALLEEIAASDPSVTVLHLRRNFGKAAALSSGFQETRGRIIITMDADLQDNPSEIPTFIDRIEAGYDLVSGWKINRKDPIEKTLPSKLFNRVVSASTGLQIHDFNCGFKAYSRKLIDTLRIYGELHRYIPALAHSQGFKVTEVPVDHRPRSYGKSKYGWERYLRGLLDLLTVLFLTRYTRKPLHLFGSVGMVLILLGTVINSYLAVLWLSGHAIGHRPLLSLGVLLMVLGVQFVSTGLLGEMMTRAQPSDEATCIDRTVRGSDPRGSEI